MKKQGEREGDIGGGGRRSNVYEEEVEDAKLWDKSNDKNCINARSASIESPYTIVVTLA